MTKTVDALSRFGERIERRLSTGEDDSSGLDRSGSGLMYSGSRSAFQRPLDKKNGKNNYYSSKRRDLAYGGAGRNHSSDNLSAAPSPSSFNNYRQNPMANQYSDRMNGQPYGTGIGGPLNYNYGGGYNGAYGAQGYGGVPGNVGYAPDYYIAERRQLELVPAPPPRVVQQPVPYPVPVDRPVPQPYPVEVQRPVPVDRPVPVPVPQPYPVDRPVPVPVAVPVPSPPPPPVRIPVPVAVPTPVPCYVPVGVPVPVPSPPPSPVMVENSITHTQRWITGSPVMMNQQNFRSGSPVMMNQQMYGSGSPVMMNQRYLAGSPAMGMNPCLPYGNGSYYR